MRKPYYKKQLHAWYYNRPGDNRPIRLYSEPTKTAEGEKLAWAEYGKKTGDCQPVTLGNDPTFAFIGHEYLEALRTGVGRKSGRPAADSTIYANERAVNGFYAFIGEKTKVSEITGLHVDKWLAKEEKKWKENKKQNKKGKDYTPTQRHNLARDLVTCFRWARKKGLIRVNPIDGYEKDTPNKRDKALDSKQWQTILDSVDGCFKDVLIALYETGCRPQELRIIENTNFDRGGKRWIIPKEKAKGKKKDRIIALTPSIVEICERLAAKYPVGSIFRNSKNRSWTHNALDLRFTHLSEKVGFKVIPYMIRHTFASRGKANGMDSSSVATLMGNSPAMVDGTYAHPEQIDPNYLQGLLQQVTQ